jgi:ribosomal protein L32
MVNRMRSNRGHRDNRRAHFALQGARLSVCKDCGSKHLAHIACPSCGKYNGKVVIDVKAKLAKKEKKSKEKTAAAAK